MTFVIRLVLVAVGGLWMRWVPPVLRLPLAARFGVYAAAGLLTLSTEMMLLSTLQFAWSPVSLLVLPLAATIGPCVWFRKVIRETTGGGGEARRPAAAISLIAIAMISIGLLAIAIASGAATSFDLLLFWGPKAVRFANARAIDVRFLAATDNSLMHPDYPPLLPLLYAWTMLGQRALNWWGVIATTPLFLLMSTATLYGFARYARSAGAESIAAIFASLYGYLFLMNAVGGNAEAALIFFETLALSALSCTRKGADEHAIIVSIALAGVVLTKAEGAPFALLSLLSFLLFAAAPVRERVRATAKGAIGPMIALLGWFVFCAHHQLLDAYRPSAGALTMGGFLSALKLLAGEAGFGVGYLPWLVLVFFVATGRLRAALPQLIAAAGYLTFLLLVYACSSSPNLLVAWSATRVLLTPLLCIVFAALAASHTDGVSFGAASRLNP